MVKATIFEVKAAVFDGKAAVFVFEAKGLEGKAARFVS